MLLHFHSVNNQLKVPLSENALKTRPSRTVHRCEIVYIHWVVRPLSTGLTGLMMQARESKEVGVNDQPVTERSVQLGSTPVLRGFYDIVRALVVHYRPVF